MQETRTAGPKPGHFHFSAGCSGLFSIVSSLFFGGFCRFIVDGQIFVVIVIIVAVIAVQQALVFVQFLFAAAQVERSGSQAPAAANKNARMAPKVDFFIIILFLRVF